MTPGYALANVDSVDIVVKGVGGHGAYPQTTRDPIVLASRIVTTLQTLVSRENDPANPAVVTVGSFQAGAKHNIISDEAKLQLTVRSYKPEVRKLLLDGIRRIARGEAIAAGMPEDKMPVVTIREEMYTPATFNTEKLSARTLELFTGHFGAAARAEDPGGDGRRGFQPLLAGRQVDREPDLLGRRHAQAGVGRGRRRPAEAALASQPLLGARRRGGDLHRDRGDDDGGAGCAEEGVALDASGLHRDWLRLRRSVVQAGVAEGQDRDLKPASTAQTKRYLQGLTEREADALIAKLKDASIE